MQGADTADSASETSTGEAGGTFAADAPGNDAMCFSGFWAAFVAYVLWGLLPVFWKGLASVNSFEVLCHRIVWSFLLLLPFMFFRGRLSSLAIFLRTPRNFLGLIFSGVLLAGNWYLYIWAIASDMVLEASLGYYINPLVSIIFGLVIFREKVGPLVKLAIATAAAGVIWQVVAHGSLPIVPLTLAFSFALYGLLRKLLLVEAIPGLFVETLVVLPIAIFWLVWQAVNGNSTFFRGEIVIDLLLVSTGVITTAPLILFAYGVRRMRMTTLGVLQYINPTCQFILGVFVYNETFTSDNLVTFACIWAALGMYTWAGIKDRKH